MKLITKLGAAGALALGAVGAMAALGGHPNAVQNPTVVPFANASDLTSTAPQANTPSPTPLAQPVAADTNDVQSGDQTTPDTAGQATASETTTDTFETGSTPESSGVQGDGSGGHQDNGDNVDHQFDGSE